MLRNTENMVVMYSALSAGCYVPIAWELWDQQDAAAGTSMYH